MQPFGEAARHLVVGLGACVNRPTAQPQLLPETGGGRTEEGAVGALLIFSHGPSRDSAGPDDACPGGHEMARPLVLSREVLDPSSWTSLAA